MDATQAIDWNISVVSPDQEQDDVEVGNLSVSYPDGQKELHRLYAGQNIVSRRSSQSQKDDERLESWRGEYSGGGPVRGIFLDSNSISSPHTNIYLEKRGELCFVKDLGSKNRTFLERGSSPLMLQGGDRYSLNSGDVVRLGNVRCQVEFQTAAPQGEGVAAEGAGAGPMQEDTQAYMSFGQTMEEGEAAGAGAGAEGAAAAAADEEAAGSSGAAAEQVRRPSRPLPPHAAQRPPSKPPAPTTAPHRKPPSANSPPEQQQQQQQQRQQQSTQAWSTFQNSSALPAQRSQSAFVTPVSALSEGVPRARDASKGRSIDSISPFSAFADSASAPGFDDVGVPSTSQVWPQPRGPTPAGGRQLLPSPFGDPHEPAAAGAAGDWLPSMQRAGSIQKVGSLHDWSVLRRSSAERLPSLQDWIMPNLGGSPAASRGALLLQHSFEAPSIPEASVAPDTALGSSLFCSEALPQPKLVLSRPKGIPPGRHPVARAAFSAADSSADEASSLDGASPSLSSWKLRAPRLPAARARRGPGRLRKTSPPPVLDSTGGGGGGGRGRPHSVSPKRDRNILDEGVFVGSFDDDAQPQKSPRLHRHRREAAQPGSPALPAAARIGPPAPGDGQDGGPGFADFHAVMDSIWGNNGIHPESTPVG